MTSLEAIEVVEKFAESLNITDPFGDKLLGCEVTAALSRREPEIDKIQERFMTGQESPEWYVDRMMRLIREHRDYLQEKKATQ